MLLSNRLMTGPAQKKISGHIAKKCGLSESAIYLGGVSELENWLKQFKDVAELAQLDPIDSPLIVSPDELARVVEALAATQSELAVIQAPPVNRVDYEEKNKFNGMTPEYAKSFSKRFMKDTHQIEIFLSDPANRSILDFFQNAADEFNLKIISKRKNYQSFDEVVNYLFDLLINRDPDLRANKRLTWAVLFYMYWHCDIGEIPDASTEQTLAS